MSGSIPLPPAVEGPTPPGLEQDDLPPAVANPTPPGLEQQELPPALGGRLIDRDCPSGSCSGEGPVR